MGLLTFAARQSYLKNRINELDYQLMMKQKTKTDLTTYTTSIGDGQITFEELSNCPSMMFNRMSQFMVNSHNAAMMGAQASMQQMSAAGVLTQQGANGAQNTQQQAAYNQLVMQNLYKQQREQAAQYEKQVLHEQEKQMDQEILALENEKKMVQAEYDSVRQACANEAKNSAPVYVA